MKLYGCIYKKQHLNDNEYWEDTAYDNQKLFVIAYGKEDAEEKVKYCLDKMGDDSCFYRYIQVGDIEEIIGITMEQEFEDSFYCSYIS